MDRLGVREARQNLSTYLTRVRAGESFVVTDHGQPVALLGPLPAPDDPLQHLVAAGLADPPRPRSPLPQPVALPEADGASERDGEQEPRSWQEQRAEREL